MLLSGCRKGDTPNTETETSNTESETTQVMTEAVTEEVATPEEPESAELVPFEFNPHVYSEKLSESYSEEYWESFYNLCDALRLGEDTFECASQEVYEWCTDDVTLGELFPAACMNWQRPCAFPVRAGSTTAT